MKSKLSMFALAMTLLLLARVSPLRAEETAVHAGKSGTAAPRYGNWGVDLDGMDRSVKPGDDFFRYVNGTWAAKTTIPADKASYGAFNILQDLSEARLRAILDGMSARSDLKAGSEEAKLASIYRSFLDEAAVEKLGLAGLEPTLEAIRKTKTREDVARLMGRSLRGYGAQFVTAAIFDDMKNSDIYALYLRQSGLGLPDRDYYLRENFKEQRERYQLYVAEMLRNIGWEDPGKAAAEVMAAETKLAEAHWTRAESRDRDRIYNPMTVAELEKYAPGFPWRPFFEEAGLAKADHPVLMQNTAIAKTAQIFSETPLGTLKAWQAFHTVDAAAPVLSKKFVDAQWEFRSKFLRGAKEQRPRWKRAVEAAENSMGEALGKVYVAENFPPEAKAKAEKLVADLLAAMKGRIKNLGWMSPETKKSALEKLATFTVKIGYPEKWQDYSKLEVREGDVFGNTERAAAFEWARQAARIGQPVDKDEWGMTPQTVNAYYMPTRNQIVFPAAILQPPFFDPNADPAVNYGGIGAGIGHEITHGFDDQGRKSDGRGMLRDWWAPEDAAKFEAQATKLGAQYEAVEFPTLPGSHIIGKLTMGENIADVGGLLIALDAYRISLGGKEAPVLDGFTGDQRVFLGYAQIWRSLFRDEALRQMLVNNPHSPGQVRAFAPLRNVDAWYEAFGVKEGEKNYVKPEDRVRIW